LEKLIEKSANLNETPDNAKLQRMLIEERDAAREVNKVAFNPYFGSVFRSANNPSFFSRRLSRFADIYTSNITNLLNYPMNNYFIPRRVDLAHESTSRIGINVTPDEV
jgi:hypothetical protein